MIDRHTADTVPAPLGARPAMLLALLGALSGFFVAGYTGVLLAATAVPLWSKRPALLGPLFLSSAMTSGAAAISAVASALEREESDADAQLRALETLSTVAEESLLVMWIIALGPTAKPIAEGRLGAVVRHGAVGAGMALPLAVSALVTSSSAGACGDRRRSSAPR